MRRHSVPEPGDGPLVQQFKRDLAEVLGHPERTVAQVIQFPERNPHLAISPSSPEVSHRCQ
jgi:hypothetical protein